mmetsp:Transcript_29118/g.32678  ORF Transcript_29118/g.32678 Transcript_29118/m.32678 type:complete len:498 (+) Transcript_29118:75-1568(+)
MGRTKQNRPVKKRRRVVILAGGNDEKSQEQAEEMAKAIELLKNTPPDRIEAAASEATRLDILNDHWIHLSPLLLPSSTTFTTTVAAIFGDSNEKNSHNNGDDDDDGNEKYTSSNVDSSKATTPSTQSTSTTGTVQTTEIPYWLRGLGLARLSANDFVALQKLHRVIKDHVNNDNKNSSKVSPPSCKPSKKWASWSGTVDDPRKRAFGFLPGTLGYDPRIRNNRLDITMPTGSSQSQSQSQSQLQPYRLQSNTISEEEIKEKERARNKQAMVVLEKYEISDCIVEAIHNLCRVFREYLLSTKKNCNISGGRGDEKDNNDDNYYRRLANFVRYENLIALQPNLHCGRPLLPVHLDDPRKDGFGVVIITIGMKESGTILFRDAKGMKRGVAMRLKAGEAYMIADKARDACSHGVLADYRPVEIEPSIGEEEQPLKNRVDTSMPFSERESLNLRFGLHDLAPIGSDSNSNENNKSADSLNIFPTSMVLRHWDGSRTEANEE